MQRLKRLREWRRHPMQRTFMILAVLALLATPLLVRADDGDSVIPPQLNWTPYPPASTTGDAVQLAEVLHAKGIISDQDYARLTRPLASTPSLQEHGASWTWEELDQRQGSPFFGGSED